MLTALTPAYWIYALLLASLAVCWADVLVRPGMLLAPVQAWARAKYRRLPSAASCEHDGREIEDAWWWGPAWGCFKCCAGQFAFWGYLLLFPLSAYHLLAHLGFTAITIILSIIVNKWSQ
ncbi:hypothetical protein [Hymenobacter ruber]